MEPAELELVQIPDGNGGTQVVLCVGGKAVIGVDTVSLGGDERGSFMDVRFRMFQIGATPEPVGESNDVSNMRPEGESEE